MEQKLSKTNQRFNTEHKDKNRVQDKDGLRIWFANQEAKKMGLVLGGGGARGCYEIGAWQAFKEAGIKFDAAAGTSIGALVGAIYTQQTLEPLVEFVMHLKPTAIASDLFYFPETLGSLISERRQIQSFLERYIYTAQGMDITPLKEAVKKMFDYDRFMRSPIDFACMTMNVTQKRPEAFFKSEMTRENAEDIILASASCFPAFPMLEMNGNLYMDGGYWNNLPVDLALEMGAEKILAIDVEGPGIIQAYNRNADVLVMKPMLPLGNFLDFSSKEGIRSMNIGYLETCKFLDLYTGYLFTFTRDNLNDMYFMDAYLNFMFQAAGLHVPKTMGRKMVRQAVGFHPSSLSAVNPEGYRYGEMVEALAYMVGIDPAKLYDYHYFIMKLLGRLNALKLESPRDSQDVMNWLHSLSRDGLLAVFHKLIKDENGLFKEFMRPLKYAFPKEFYGAWVWYFLGEAYERTGIRK